MKKMIELCPYGVPKVLGHGQIVSLDSVYPAYAGKGIYSIKGQSGLWYIRAAKFGWGYVATPA